MALRTLPYRNTALKATKAVVQTGGCELYGWHIYNQDVTDTWLHFYDALTANVTVGTTTPTYTMFVPASGILDVWESPGNRDCGLLVFATGLVLAATTTIGGSSANTNGLLVNLGYL